MNLFRCFVGRINKASLECSDIVILKCIRCDTELRKESGVEIDSHCAGINIISCRQ